jgi:hypothetical protein
MVDMEVAQRIEQELANVGIQVFAEDDGRAIVLSGMVQSDIEHSTVYEIAGAIAPGRDLVDNIEMTMVLPSEIGELELSEAVAGDFPAATQGTQDDESLEPGDFTDQHTLSDPFTASGPSGTASDQELGEGEDVYVPPIDPVLDRNGEVVNGFGLSAMDSLQVDRSAADGNLGDEAIADAIRRELREDSSTAELEIEVEVNAGIVTLLGTVADLDDAENAEEVASRLPGVREVREQLSVTNI